MRIILLEDINTLGYKDDIVEVKDGYGRNFLIPQKKAILATKGNVIAMEDRKRQQKNKFEKMISELRETATKIEATEIKITAKTGTSGKIFGNVTSVQLSDALVKQAAIEVDRRKIRILDEIKMLGSYNAEIELHREVKVTCKFEVVGE